MAPEGLLSIPAASVVEDVLQQHWTRPRDIDMASRRSEEAASRRHEAAAWLRKTLGALAEKDLLEKPTEEEFLLALRSGLILCNALNNVHPGAVPKVRGGIPVDPALLPDGAALSAYQYFENVRNFLVAVQDKGLPTFEASDLEKGGKCSRVVNCVLALKSYCEWKQMGGTGLWKYGGNLKSAGSGKYYIRKNSELFINSVSRNICSNGKLQDDQKFSSGFNDESSEMTTSHSLNMLVRAVLSDRKPEEIPSVVESMLKKVVEEFERRMVSQNEMVQTTSKDFNGDGSKVIYKRRVLAELMEMEEENCAHGGKDDTHVISEEKCKQRLAKQNAVFESQQKDIQELKHILGNTRAGMQTIQTNYVQEITTLGRHLRSLADAASGYHRVLEENRKLYNEVQDLKGNIRVYCRVRPFLPGNDGNITIINPSKNGKEGHKSFTFNKVFGPSATQEEIYSDTQPLIRSVLDGFNVCIFAYGQTGSGKTYTMTGPRDITEQSQGVNYRALSDLFQLSERRKDTITYHIAVQMIEIYNEQVRDLLVSDGIRNSSQKGLNVPNASLVPVSSTSEVIELMNIGQRNRAVGATALNDRSSRSHSCLTVHVQGREVASGAVLRGCMHLVDLAGSERVLKSEVTGERMKEAQHINRSLSALGDVIAALAQKNSHVPYRNSKLTQLLQDSLTLMFVHVSPEQDAAGETISTLKFAERVSSVELGAARLNKENGEIKELKEQIAHLKAALARKESSEAEEAAGSLKSTPSVRRTMLFTPLSKSTAWREHNNNSLPRRKRPGSDLQEQLLAAADSPPWPDNSSPCVDSRAGEENETDSQEWVDKVMVNKLDRVGSNGSSLSDWAAERDGVGGWPSEIGTTDSEDQIVVSSGSSESNPAVSASASKTKKPQQKLAKTPDAKRLLAPVVEKAPEQAPASEGRRRRDVIDRRRSYDGGKLR
ncbi:unnamed protein product [Spirodela intermedia]|uniref:Uncharacterized protein n=1 Tax=Spirodela intermedia TaxID=51605 RepID=A0A7I8JG55_SPIIN|nr:unnamed protein product [Spirodela intermedia]CAA6669134.1 unnamed protein product [Spirodela intermedia]